MAKGEVQAARRTLAWGGDYGTDTLDGAGTSTGGPWGMIIAKGATTITAMTANYDAVIGAMADGEAMHGTFTSVTISGGKLYLRRTEEADELAISALT